MDRASGTILLVSSGDWHSSEIGDKSDEWISSWIKSLGAGRISVVS